MFDSSLLGLRQFSKVPYLSISLYGQIRDPILLWRFLCNYFSLDEWPKPAIFRNVACCTEYDDNCGRDAKLLQCGKFSNRLAQDGPRSAKALTQVVANFSAKATWNVANCTGNWYQCSDRFWKVFFHFLSRFYGYFLATRPIRQAQVLQMIPAAQIQAQMRRHQR